MGEPCKTEGCDGILIPLRSYREKRCSGNCGYILKNWNTSKGQYPLLANSRMKTNVKEGT